jgi:hypothetical protein
MPALERVNGPEHPSTLETLNELARWTGLAGNPAAARDLLAKLLPVLERVLGPEHPDTNLTRTHLARWAERADAAPSGVLPSFSVDCSTGPAGPARSSCRVPVRPDHRTANATSTFESLHLLVR